MKNNKTTQNRQGFLIINNNIFLSDNFINLHDSSKIVYLCLCHFSNGKGKAVWPSQKMLSEMTNHSERGVRYCLRQLEEHGLISTTYNNGKGNTYEFLTPANIDTPELDCRGANVRYCRGGGT